MKTIIKIVTENQEIELPVSKIVSIRSDKDFIYFDKLNDDTYRMTYTKGSKVKEK